VTRFEIDIPGQVEQELVGYPILPDSMILGLTKLPKWARPVMVVRDKDTLDPSQAGPLQPGDYAYFLAPPRRVFRLDQLFAESADTGRHAAPVFGEMAVNGDAAMGELSRLYDLGIAGEDAEMTVADYFARYRRDTLKAGHRLPAGRGWLVARQLKDGRVMRAGLQLEEMMGSWLATLARSEGGRLNRHTRKLRRAARNLGQALKDMYTRRPEPPRD
jgi:cell volume regulation protein A